MLPWQKFIFCLEGTIVLCSHTKHKIYPQVKPQTTKNWQTIPVTGLATYWRLTSPTQPCRAIDSPRTAKSRMCIDKGFTCKTVPTQSYIALLNCQWRFGWVRRVKEGVLWFCCGSNFCSINLRETKVFGFSKKKKKKCVMHFCGYNIVCSI